MRPTPSPDGKKIAFVRRERTKSKLYVKDLASGEERKVYDALDQDVQETWAVTGVYPNMAWTPDSKSLVFWAGGKIRRVDADGGDGAVIPFRVNDTRGVIDAPHPQIAVAPDRFTTKMPRFAAVSPDGRQVVFESLGKLWVKPMAGGERAAADRAATRASSCSRPGRATARRSPSSAGPTQDLGRIRTVAAAGGAPRDVTTQPGHYARPRFLAGRQDDRVREGQRRRPDLAATGRRIPASIASPRRGGAPVRVAKGMAAPQFGAANDRVFMVGIDKGKRMLVSTDLNGEAQAHPCHRRTGERLHRLARRPARSPSARTTRRSSCR